MPEVITFTIDTRHMSASALKLMKAAVNYAEENRQCSSHIISLTNFCALADLPLLSHLDFLKLVEEASRAVAIVETVDTLSIDRDDLPFMCWSIFVQVSVKEDGFSFNVSHRTFDKSMMERLRGL